MPRLPEVLKWVLHKAQLGGAQWAPGGNGHTGQWAHGGSGHMGAVATSYIRLLLHRR